MVEAIFAVSSTGADLYLLNADMSGGQLRDLLNGLDPDLLVYDEECAELLRQTTYAKPKLISYHDTLPAIDNLHAEAATDRIALPRASSGKLVLLTGGTTGRPKEAAHRPSLFNYLNPFAAFVSRLRILQYDNAYIATPIYHGYGIAVLLLCFAVGKKVFVRREFDAAKACRLIRDHRVEIATVVPLMLHKMLRTNADDLKSLACIASGGAELSPGLAEETLRRLGKVLYNLYGTSETGLNFIATPEDLQYDARTVGRKIKGVRAKILDARNKEVGVGQVGRICIRNGWSISDRSARRIDTGDLGYADRRGRYFLCGRADSMIVSAGENVYPLEVEQALQMHPQVEEAAVIGVSDELFGQRLKAVVVPASDAEEVVTPEQLRDWLRTRLARYQMPREIVIADRLPYTTVGKPDKRRLLAEHAKSAGEAMHRGDI